jgi:hypothetical protein
VRLQSSSRACEWRRTRSGLSEAIPTFWTRFLGCESTTDDRFFADVAESDEEEEEDGDAEANTRQGRRDAANAKQERAAERQRQREKLKTDIAQAVGGPLMD